MRTAKLFCITYDTVRILLGTDTALEEKMTRVAAILPSLSGLSENSIWRITRTATAALSSRKMYKRKGKPSKKRNNPEFFMKYEKNRLIISEEIILYLYV